MSASSSSRACTTRSSVDSVHLVEISQDAGIGGARRLEADENGGTASSTTTPRPSTTALRAWPRRARPSVRCTCLAPAAAASCAPTTSSAGTPPRCSSRRCRGRRGRARVAIGIWHEPSDERSAPAIELAEALTQIAALSPGPHRGRASAAAPRCATTPRSCAPRARWARSLELPEVLSALGREADLALGGDIAGVYLGDAEPAAWSWPATESRRAGTGQVMPPGEGVGGQTLVTGRTAMTNDYQADIARQPHRPARTTSRPPSPCLSLGRLAARRALRRLQPAAARSTPRTSRCSRRSPTWPPWPARTPRPTRRRRAAAATDSLTGVLNHGAMQVTPREEIERARRSGEPCAHRARPRRLQAAQRRLRPPRRRPLPAPRRRGARPRLAALRRAGPLRRRRVRARAPGRRPRRPSAWPSACARRSAPLSRELGLSIEVDAVGRARPSGASPWPPASCSTGPTARCCWPSAAASARVVVAGPETDEQLAMLDLDPPRPPSSCASSGRASPPSTTPRGPALAARAAAPRARPRGRRAARRRRAAPVGHGRRAHDLGPRSRGSLTELLEAFGLKATCALPYGRRLLRRRPAAARRHAARRCCSCAPAPTSSRTERLQQAELIGRQATMLLSGRTGDGSPAAVQGARRGDRRPRQLHPRALRPGRVAGLRGRAPARPARRARSSASSARRCSTTSARSRSPTRSSTSAARSTRPSGR